MLNRMSGSATATVYMDRAPREELGSLPAGSFYIHVRGLGARTEEASRFIGWVIELFNMEGVR